MNKTITKLNEQLLLLSEAHDIMYDCYSENEEITLYCQHLTEENWDMDWSTYIDYALELAYVIQRIKDSGKRIKNVSTKYISSVDVDTGEEINIPIVSSLKF